MIYYNSGTPTHAQLYNLYILLFYLAPTRLGITATFRELTPTFH